MKSTASAAGVHPYMGIPAVAAVQPGFCMQEADAAADTPGFTLPDLSLADHQDAKDPAAEVGLKAAHDAVVVPSHDQPAKLREGCLTMPGADGQASADEQPAGEHSPHPCIASDSFIC